MKKFVLASLVVLAVLTAVAGIYLLNSEDPKYLLRETIFSSRYRKIRRPDPPGRHTLRSGPRTHQGHYLA